jgi:hypothetical protein
MRRTSLAALLAAPALLAFPGFAHFAHAHPPKQCFSPFGFGGFCPGIFSKLHQHGPLFNYGPYYGYPPFEPYGPWNQYLQYTGGFGGGGNGGGGGHGHGHGGHGDMAGRGGICTGGGGGGWHSSWSGGGWFHGAGCASCGHTSLFHGHGASGGGCASCQTTASNSSMTNPASRYAGAGAPGDSAVFYAGLPTIHPTAIATTP